MDKPIHQGPDQLFPSNQSVAWLANQAVRLRADDKDIASDPPVSVVTAFKLVTEEFPDRIALVDSYNDVEDIYTYKRYYESVTHVAKAFIKLGLKSYHGVGIIGFNAAPWFISYLGTIFAGGLAGGMHPLSSEETFSCLADSAECNIIIVEGDELLESVLKIADDLPHLKAIIKYRGKPKDGTKKVYSWDEILEMKVDECEEEFQRRIKDMAPNKCCTLVATSGTTGKPKWVMLSHDNLLWNVKSMMSFINENKNYPPDTQVSYQTLSHVSAFLFDIYWPIMCKGGTVIIAKRYDSKRTLAETLRKAKPTFFVGIPKVFEMIMNSFLESEINNNVFRKKCFSWAMKVSQSSIDSKFRNNKGIRFKIVKHFFLKKMAARLGFNKCRFALVGASSCKQEVLEFFLEMGIPLMECYGMSEGGCIATNLKSCLKINSVGQMVPGVQLKLKQVFDGEGTEICLFGRNMFMGYLKDEQRSKQAFDENLFYHTSDLGQLDENGILNLVGRLKDVIIMRDSRKVFPLSIEKRILDQMPCLSYCVLVGEGRDFISALLVFKAEFDPKSGELTDFLDQAALDWCRKLGVNEERLSELVSSKDPKIAEEIQKVINKINDEAADDKEVIHKWMILPKYFSVAGGEIGLTMKLKRNAINELYQKEISKFYE